MQPLPTVSTIYKVNKTLATVLIFMSLVSCQTYKTYYGITRQQLERGLEKKTYRLDLSFQNLEALPENLKAFKALRMLNLSGNPKIDLQKAVDVLVLLPELKVLILDSMQLNKLPENFYKLRQLNHLSLASNPGLDFSDAFEKIASFSIEFLNLSHNQLKELPENLAEIKQIRDLKLSDNRLQAHQALLVLSDLPNLRSLWLDFNGLNQLPAEIATLGQLRYLYLDANNLEELPEAMSGMKRLLVMHATQNRFTELPGVLTRMQSLMFVIFSNNPIETIPPVFHNKNYSLLALVMDGNRLDDREKRFYKKMFRRFFIFSAK